MSKIKTVSNTTPGLQSRVESALLTGLDTLITYLNLVAEGQLSGLLAKTSTWKMSVLVSKDYDQSPSEAVLQVRIKFTDEAISGSTFWTASFELNISGLLELYIPFSSLANSIRAAGVKFNEYKLKDAAKGTTFRRGTMEA